MSNLEASKLANRMVDAGATVDDLRHAVTREMMLIEGERAARQLARHKRLWEDGHRSHYRQPRWGTQWAVCVKRDLIVASVEVETWILALPAIQLIDAHDRSPGMPFKKMSEVRALDPLSTTTYRHHGRIGSFPILLEDS